MRTIRKVIDSLLSTLGYYRCDMPEGALVTEAEIIEMFKTYGENEMFVRFLRDMCAQDIRLYFQASNDMDRNTLRGAYSRNNYFISLIRKSNGKRKSSRGSKGNSGS